MPHTSDYAAVLPMTRSAESFSGNATSSGDPIRHMPPNYQVEVQDKEERSVNRAQMPTAMSVNKGAKISSFFPCIWHQACLKISLHLIQVHGQVKIFICVIT